MDRGRPISYLVLQPGTPVLTADGERVGEVARVLAHDQADVFDGLLLDTEEGERFVDAAHVGDLHERAVELTLSAEQARGLPEPRPNPAEIEARAGDVHESDLTRTIRQVWDRISGNY